MVTPKNRERLRIGFIGAGTVATALAIHLHSSGYPITSVASRSFSSAQALSDEVPGCTPAKDQQDVLRDASIIFLTVPDDLIRDTANNLEWGAHHMVAHCSGSLGLDVLDGPRHLAAQIGVLHPFQTFANTVSARENVSESTFAVEAGEPFLGILKGFVADLGGIAVDLSDKNHVLYHLSGVIASNYLVTLANIATELWTASGLAKEDALRAVLPLMRGTLSNLEEKGLPESLTGPISRGDIVTVEKHLSELQENRPDLLPLYGELGLQTLQISAEKNQATKENLDEIRNAVGKSLAKEHS
jgi:predicted short-subunit dehydrogenase-like oxidoreductase (DUF2520 family)